MDSREYIAVPYRSYQSGSDTFLIQDLLHDTMSEIDAYAMSVLQSLDRFRSLREHAAEYAKAAAGSVHEASADAFKAIASLARKNLTMDRLELQAGLLGAPDRLQPSSIETISWSTRARTDSLMLSLESFMRNCREHDRNPSFRICDDSRLPAQRDANRAGLARLAERHAAKIEYFGAEEKAGLVERIVRLAAGEGAPRELVEFALFGPAEASAHSYGVNYNCAMLLSSGSVLFNVDDDCLARPAATPGHGNTISLDLEETCLDFSNFSGLEEALACAPEDRIDILGSLAAMLGSGVADQIRDRGPARIAYGRASAQKYELFADPRTHAALVTGGSYGDSGTEAPTWLLSAGPDDAGRSFESDAAFEIAAGSRIVWRRPRFASLTRNRSFLAMYFALDDDPFQPPFPPHGRESDAVFSSASLAIDPRRLIGRVPFSLLHDPPERPSRFEPGSLFGDQFTYIEMLLCAIGQYEPSASEGESCYLSYCRYLESVAGLNENSFIESYRMHLFMKYAKLLRHWRRLAERKELCRLARRYIDERSRELEELIVDLDGAIREARESGRFTREFGYLKRYTELTRLWPSLRRRLAETEILPGRNRRF